MTASSEIPYPRLTRRYVGLKDRSSEQRLQQANATTATELVEETTVARASATANSGRRKSGSRSPTPTAG